MSVRALFRAATVESAVAPYNTLHLKVFYPVQPSGGSPGQIPGMVPPDAGRAPFPIVLLFNGINCGPELYQWLAMQLAERGLVVVTFSWVAENLPGIVALTPGVDLNMWAPGLYGTGPTASALPTLLKALEHLQTEGGLAGLLDLSRIVLGGHSAGGRVAIESASPQFCPSVVAAFAYGAHMAATPQLGYPPDTIQALPDALPLLLLGGTCDGVIASSSQRYGATWEDATTPIRRTFEEAIAGGRGDSYLLLLEGANHFLITDPLDRTAGDLSLDLPASQPEGELRSFMAEAIGLFIDAHVRTQAPALAALHHQLESGHPLIAAFACK